jgi:hypothetical protein
VIASRTDERAGASSATKTKGPHPIDELAIGARRFDGCDVTTSRILGPGVSQPATPRRPARAQRAAEEVRWFVAGDIDDELRPRGPSRHRTDVYHLASLSPASSLKRRNTSGPLEWKARVGRRKPCEISGVPGGVERWVKQQLRERDLNQPLLGNWIDVRKQLWRVGGLEICRLDIDTQAWWTIAVPTAHPNKTMRKIVAAWGPLLRASAQATSYPMWVLTYCHEDPQTTSTSTTPVERHVDGRQTNSPPREPCPNSVQATAQTTPKSTRAPPSSRHTPNNEHVVSPASEPTRRAGRSFLTLAYSRSLLTRVTRFGRHLGPHDAVARKGTSAGSASRFEHHLTQVMLRHDTRQ